MYNETMAVIGDAITRKPEATVRAVGYFVSATIQQRFHTMPTVLDDWHSSGIDAPTCWGNKKNTVKHLDANSAHLASQILTLREDRNNPLAIRDSIDVLLTIPGLGIVKAAFFAQILGFDVGCIDVHNARKFGVKLAAFNVTTKLSARTRLAKIESYKALCDGLGGSAYLWDQWCTLVAMQYPTHLADPTVVSDLHHQLITKYI